jgi:hypothetical protein
LVDINSIWNTLTAKWVFKRKRDTDYIIQRFRARLVARGFQQRDGIDYGEIVSPVVRYTTLRMLLATQTFLPKDHGRSIVQPKPCVPTTACSNAIWIAPKRSHKLTWTLPAT